MSYTYNKKQKDKELCKLISASITKDIRETGLDKEEFANSIGLSLGTLENKLKPSSPNDFTITELIDIMDTTGDYRVLEYIAGLYGFVLSKATSEEKSFTDTITHIVISNFELEESLGDLAHTIKEAIKDEKIDEDEAKEIKKKTAEVRKKAVNIEEFLK